MRDVRKDFPVLVNNPQLVYLDSACTSLKPLRVIEASSSYYNDLGACAGRSSHGLGRRTSERVEEARVKVSRFIGAERADLVWTRNATEALNIVAGGFDFSKRKKVVTTVMEHHSVLLPFMRLQERGVVKLEILPCDGYGEVSLSEWENAVDKETALVVTHSWNNTTGTGRDMKSITAMAHDKGALVCVDGAQGVPHHRTEMRREGYDFLCFSGHKMLGPTGIGALAMKESLFERIDPLLLGGGTVRVVKTDHYEVMKDHSKFEAGIQDYSGILGLAAACDYLKELGMENVERHERELAAAMRKELENCGASAYGPKESYGGHGGLYSFNFKKAKPHDIALMLDKHNIAVRSGFFCAQPGLEAIGANEGAVRASCYVYNTPEDIRKFGEALAKIRILYG